MLEGRGLFYGAAAANGGVRIFTPSDWETQCQQAKAWGLDLVHPKVADGPHTWYDNTGLVMLRDTAARYGLRCIPYNYCWGNKYPYGNDPNQLTKEAELTAQLGIVFGALCPDIEIEWDNQRAWATQFGEIVRKNAPHAEFYPTLFANPQSHLTPYLELLQWCNGWMPMAYYDLWTTKAGAQMTTKEAIAYLYPQWIALDNQVKAKGYALRPILPIIEVGNHLPQAEITSWLQLTQDYGYCGFWYDGWYAAYAQTIKDAPHPKIPRPTTIPTMPASTSSTSLAGKLPSSGLYLDTKGGAPVLKQQLTEKELQVLWHRLAPIPWTPDFALCGAWIWLLQNRPDIALGSPVRGEIPVTIDGQDVAILALESGRALVYYKASTRVVLL